MARAKKTDYVYADDKTIALYQRPGSSFWQARIQHVNGKCQAISTRQTDLDKALAWAREHKIMVKVLTARGQDPTAATFKRVAERWLSSIAEGDNPRTIHDYTTIVQRYHIPYLGKFKITEITQQVLRDYEQWRKSYWTTGPGSQEARETIERKDGKIYVRAKKMGSRSKAYSEDTVLRQIFAYAVEHDHLPASRRPVIGTPRSKSRKVVLENRYPAFTQDQVEKILAYCAESTRAKVREAETGLSSQLDLVDQDRLVFNVFVYLILGTGMRPGREHSKLKWKHLRHETVDGVDHLIVTVPPGTKTGKRDVRCDNFAMTKLVAFRMHSTFRGDDDYILADQETGQAVKSFKRQFSTMCRVLGFKADQVGKPFVPYSLRHTYATLKLNAGVDIRLIANNMGNSPEVVHAHYGHDTAVSRANELSTKLDWMGVENPLEKPRKRPRQKGED
ncbi:conserved hypothetical protein [Magnetospirillum molischianum DSM 120]|uniref:Tyr recombinase domain-containing protein n=2 Tax=Magnetospirillum molischianum TaxID=1083 RepID=H8FN51_MAGML|nr:conserved hypothetical protein [Magnetospirillum molischianum DSM 120]